MPGGGSRVVRGLVTLRGPVVIDYRLPVAELPDPLPIEPCRKAFDVTVTPPGSKSRTNRAYVLAALALGSSRIRRPLRSDDCDRLATALQTLGAGIEWDGDDLVVHGVDGRFAGPAEGGRTEEARVDLGDGGTPARFMIAVACLAGTPAVIDGSPRMRERPVAEGVEMLRALGAQIEYLEDDARLPVRVNTTVRAEGGALTVGATQSSQFVSAVMLIAACLDRGVHLTFTAPLTSASYVHMTAEMLETWGIIDAAGDVDTGVITIAPQTIEARTVTIPPDASSAVYWLAAAAVTPEARVFLPGVERDGSQPDLEIIDALESMGATCAQEERAGVRGVVMQGPEYLGPVRFDARNCPDGALALAAAAACADGRSTISGLHTLRVKETDRITALANELGRIGCEVRTTDDSISIDPRARSHHPVVVQTYRDHRMAMAFAILGLYRGGILIADPPCVTKSYPGFFRDLAGLYEARGDLRGVTAG